MFRLRARADRIEHRNDGRYAILDYKTGQMPTAPQVQSGLAPQLSLEAAILRAGRLRHDIPAGASIAEFIYVSLRGGDPPGEGEADRMEGYDARRGGRSGARAGSRPWSPSSTTETRPIARASGRCSCAASRRLRPSGARQGMVAVRRCRRSRGRRRMSAAPFPTPSSPISMPRPIRRSSAWVFGQRRLGQDPRAGATCHPPAARWHRSGENPLPDLHQGRGRQYGEPRLRHAQPNGSTLDDAALDKAIRAIGVRDTGAEAAARRRGGCSRQRWRRRAGSRSRPSTASARGCCSSFRSRPMSPRAFACSKRPSRTRCWRTSAARCCSTQPAAGRRRRPRAGRHHADRQRLRLPACARTRRSGERERNRGLGRPRRRPRCSDAASFREALGIKPRRYARRGRGRDRRRSTLAACANGHPRRRCCAQSSKNDQDQGARLTEALAGAGSTRIEAYISVFFSPTRASRANRSSRRRLRKNASRSGQWLRRRTGAHAVALRKAARRADARPHHGAAHARDRDDRALSAPRKNRRGLLDYDDLITHTRTLLERVECGLGALQARPRHRPSADRRGAGHEPRAMGHHQAVRRRVHQPAPARAAACGARSSRSATTSNRSSRSRARRRRRSPRCTAFFKRAHEDAGCRSGRSVPIFVPVGAGGAGGGGCRVQAAGRPRRPDGHCRGDRA